MPEDVETARAAGVQYARALAGAPTATFMLALGEQEQLVHLMVVEAGLGEWVARSAADAFELGARLEWERLAPVMRMGAAGRA